MKHPEITVYIVSHNYGKYLEEAIESVLRQTVDDWELLIINDNSTDNTRKVMNFYQGDERITLVDTEGIGLPAVCNLAMRMARGKYIIRLDGDDIFDENCLLVLRNWLERHPDEAMVFSDFFYIDERGQVYAHERRERIYERNHALDMAANGACCLIRTGVLREIGGYREDLGAQDGFDLWNKLMGRYRCSNVNLPLFYYRRHGDNLTNKLQHILHARRSIKLDMTTAKLDRFRPIIAVIPCRKNYDFCPNVWSREVKGKTLLQWDIEKCIASPLFDHVVVASDTHQVKEVLNLFSDQRLSFLERKPENTLRSKSIVATLERITAAFDPQQAGLTVLSYNQAPFVTTATLEEAVTTLVLNEAQSSLGVEEVKECVFKRNSHGLFPINPPRGLSSDFDVVYREANIALATRNSNLRSGSLTGATAVYFTVSRDECFFISSEQKLQIANILAENV
ncbi:MAG: glycosyltransferase family 2 protein [Deltaproteobacteria bacterium]|nr:glycosyltransferase family 2 protein [Deltaproteobacteria bacterium]